MVSRSLRKYGDVGVPGGKQEGGGRTGEEQIASPWKTFSFDSE